MSAPRAAILDVDGTLVDSVYQHAICWQRAFAERELRIPAWRCHRAIGMGGDHLVPELAGDQVEGQLGDALRERENQLFAELSDEVGPLPGAAELVAELSERGHEVVLASSGEEQAIEEHLELLGIESSISGYTTSADVENSKPEPDLLRVALEKVSAAAREGAVLVGDSTWDVESAARAGIDCIGLLTGGFSEGELREAGAGDVFRDPEELREHLDETALG